MFSIQTWEWYWSSHLTLGNKMNIRDVSQNVKLCLLSSLLPALCVARGACGEENLSFDAWDVCCWISQGLRLCTRFVTIGKHLKSLSFVTLAVKILAFASDGPAPTKNAKNKILAGWNLGIALIFRLLPLQVTWWAGPWRTWTSCWPCRTAAGSRTWCCLLPTSSSSTTWKAQVSWPRIFRTGRRASWRAVSCSAIDGESGKEMSAS